MWARLESHQHLLGFSQTRKLLRHMPVACREPVEWFRDVDSDHDFRVQGAAACR